MKLRNPGSCLAQGHWQESKDWISRVQFQFLLIIFAFHGLNILKCVFWLETSLGTYWTILPSHNWIIQIYISMSGSTNVKVCFEKINCRISHLEPPIYKDHDVFSILHLLLLNFLPFRRVYRGKAEKLKNGWIGEKLDCQHSNRDTLKKYVPKALGWLFTGV